MPISILNFKEFKAIDILLKSNLIKLKSLHNDLINLAINIAIALANLLCKQKTLIVSPCLFVLEILFLQESGKIKC